MVFLAALYSPGIAPVQPSLDCLLQRWDALPLERSDGSFGLPKMASSAISHGALMGQGNQQDPQPSVPFGMPVVARQRLVQPLGQVPGSIVPEDDEEAHPLCGIAAHDPFEVLPGLVPLRRHLPRGRVQIGIQAGAGWGLPLLPALRRANPLRALPGRPSTALPRPEHEPTLVGEGCCPGRVSFHPAQQPVAPSFLKASPASGYPGSGLVTHSLARCQDCLCSRRSRRMLSRLICSVQPFRTKAAAASFRLGSGHW